MRLWSIHPKYLDTKGLVALWREALLAKKVLEGETKGYKNHPQLIRFRVCQNPQLAINSYLNEIYKEASRRSYCFDQSKIGKVIRVKRIPVTRGQLTYEFQWLCHKLKTRNKNLCQSLSLLNKVEPHPLFKIIKGDIADWEKIRKC